MRHRKLATSCFALAAALAMAPTDARAAKGSGWLQLEQSSSRFSSKKFSGVEFAIGYTTSWGVNAYDWNGAPDTITVSCETRAIHPPGQPPEQIYSESCATLPGTKLATRTWAISTTCEGFPYPCTIATTEIVWSVPKTGMMVVVDGTFSVPLVLFDESYDLFKLKLSSDINTSGLNEIHGSVHIVGKKVASRSYPVSTEAEEEKREVVGPCARLAKASTQFLVAGVPIAVTSSVDGCLYLDESVSWRNNALTGTLTPGSNVDATVSAGTGFKVGGIKVKAGVSGSLTIIDASLPVSVSVAPQAGGTVSANGKLTLRALDGKLKVFAKACIRIFGKKKCPLDAKRTLFDWTGMSSSSTIFSVSQTLPE